MNNRTATQITSHFDAQGKYFVLALCDDGSLWKLSGLYEGKPVWEEFPRPPNNDDAEGEQIPIGYCVKK